MSPIRQVAPALLLLVAACRSPELSDEARDRVGGLLFVPAGGDHRVGRVLDALEVVQEHRRLRGGTAVAGVATAPPEKLIGRMMPAKQTAKRMESLPPPG